MNIDLTEEEIGVLLKSGSHCLSTCHEGGPDQHCPDCQRLERAMVKLKAGAM